MGDRWILAVDLGNGGPKVAVVGLDGEVRRTAMRPVRVHIGLDGAATQDATEWWGGLVDATREAIDAAGADPSALHAVGITGQWGSSVPVDVHGEPAGDVLLWADTRARDLVRQVIGGPVSVSGIAPHKALPYVRVTGGAPSPSGADPTGHSLLLRERLAEVYARTATILEPDGRLFGTVCGFDPASVIGPDDLASAIDLLAFMGDMLTLALAADRERQDLHEALADSEVDAETDALTGLANRRRWDRMVSDEEHRFRRLADPTVVVIVDLDGLKRINDSEGHADGDGYLRAAADALRASVRSTDVVARLGGDEFAVLLRQCDAGTATDVVAKVEASLADRHVEASIGWSVANVGSGLSTAVAEADARMYAQKATRVAR